MRKAQVETQVQSVFQPGVNISSGVEGPRSSQWSCSLCRPCLWWPIPSVSEQLVRVGFIPERRQQDSPKKAIHPGTQPSETAGVCEWGGAVCRRPPSPPQTRGGEQKAGPCPGRKCRLSLPWLCCTLSLVCPCLGVFGVCAHWHPPCSTVPSGTCTQPLLKARVLVKMFYSFKEDPPRLS